MNILTSTDSPASGQPHFQPSSTHSPDCTPNINEGLPIKHNDNVVDDTHVETNAEDVSPAPTGDRGFIGTIFAITATAMPAGGMLGTTFNMASTAIGAGILGLPDAFNNTGYVMSIVYLTAITAETIYSTVLLAEAAEISGLKTYEKMANSLLFHRADILVAIIRFVHCFGACVGYVVTAGDLISPIVKADDGDTPTFWQDKKKGVRVIQSILWLCFMLPCVIPREVNALRYVSTIGVTFVFYFVIVVVVHTCMSDFDAPNIKPVVTGNNAVKGVGVFIFSYMCQVNSNDIFYEMTNRSIFRFGICTSVSMIFCGVLYFVTGMFGYLEFGSNIDGSILKSYTPLEEPQVLISFIGVFIKITASYGLLANAARNSMYHIFRWDPMTVVFWKHCVAVIVLSCCALVLGLIVPNVNLVFSLIGGICGGSLGFLFPAFFRMFCGNWTLASVGWVNYISTYLTLFGGVVGVVFGTASTIYSI